MKEFKYKNVFNCGGWFPAHMYAIIEAIGEMIGTRNEDYRVETFLDGEFHIYTNDQSWLVMCKLSETRLSGIVFKYFKEEQEVEQ